MIMKTCRGSSLAPGSWEDAARQLGLADAVDSLDESGSAHRVELVALQPQDGATECIDHGLVQAVVDFLQRPGEVLQSLHPFEVRNRDTARIAEDVRQNENAAIPEHFIGFERGRAVGA